MSTIPQGTNEIAALERLPCECETFGYCWPCREIARLRAELRTLRTEAA